MGKNTVESAHALSIAFLNKHDYFCGYKSGGIAWTWGMSENKSSISFDVETCNDEQPYVRLRYTSTDRFTEKKTDLNYKVSLTSTPCNLGGKRWWFICPLIVGGRPCGRRVGVLYSGSPYFGCRHCLQLTYESCNSNKRYRALGQMFDYERKAEDVFKNMKRERHFYRGKPTKRHLRFEKYLDWGNSAAAASLESDLMKNLQGKV